MLRGLFYKLWYFLTTKIFDWEVKEINCTCIFVCRMPVKSFIKIGDMKVKNCSVWRGMTQMWKIKKLMSIWSCNMILDYLFSNFNLQLVHKFYQLRSLLTCSVMRSIYLALIQSVIQYGMMGRGCSITNSSLFSLNELNGIIIKTCLNKPDYGTNVYLRN